MYHLTQNDLAILVITCLVFALIGGIVSMIYILKYQKIKKQSETDSGIIARNLQRIIQLETEKEILKGEIKAQESKIDLLEEINRFNLAKLSRKNQPRDSKGHFIKIKPIEAEKWQCIKRIYPQFEQGKEYTQDKSISSSNDGLIWLFENENHLHPYLVEKKYFKPITVKSV